MVISPRLTSPVLHVKDLFYLGTQIWDSGLLERTFLLWEAELIKAIPVSEGRVEDRLIWPLRSAYLLLMDEVSCQEPSTSSSEEFQQVAVFGGGAEFGGYFLLPSSCCAGLL
nr:hypothetical protein CFP56_47369 [Quercus suber]